MLRLGRSVPLDLLPCAGRGAGGLITVPRGFRAERRSHVQPDAARTQCLASSAARRTSSASAWPASVFDLKPPTCRRRPFSSLKQRPARLLVARPPLSIALASDLSPQHDRTAQSRSSSTATSNSTSGAVDARGSDLETRQGERRLRGGSRPATAPRGNRALAYADSRGASLRDDAGASPGSRCSGALEDRCRECGQARSQPATETARASPLESWEEIEAVVDELGPWAPVAIVAAGSGLRPEELFALQWRDIDRRASVVHVRRAYARGRLKEWGKTERSRRRVPLRDRVLEALDEVQRWIDRPLVFSGARGGYVDLHNFRAREWIPAVKAAGFDRRGQGREADLRTPPQLRDDESRCRRFPVLALAADGNLGRDDRPDVRAPGTRCGSG